MPEREPDLEMNPLMGRQSGEGESEPVSEPLPSQSPAPPSTEPTGPPPPYTPSVASVPATPTSADLDLEHALLLSLLGWFISALTLPLQLYGLYKVGLPSPSQALPPGSLSPRLLTHANFVFALPGLLFIRICMGALDGFLDGSVLPARRVVLLKVFSSVALLVLGVLSGLVYLQDGIRIDGDSNDGGDRSSGNGAANAHAGNPGTSVRGAWMFATLGQLAQGIAWGMHSWFIVPYVFYGKQVPIYYEEVAGTNVPAAAPDAVPVPAVPAEEAGVTVEDAAVYAIGSGSDTDDDAVEVVFDADAQTTTTTTVEEAAAAERT